MTPLKGQIKPNDVFCTPNNSLTDLPRDSLGQRAVHLSSAVRSGLPATALIVDTTQ